MKVCSKCGAKKDLECFVWNKARNAWSSWCRKCRNEYAAEYRQRAKRKKR